MSDERKFKVGDRVELINTSEIGSVQHFDPHGVPYYFKPDCRGGFWVEGRTLRHLDDQRPLTFQYEPTGKAISLKALWDAQSDHDSLCFLREWAAFMRMVTEHGVKLKWSQIWHDAQNNFIKGVHAFATRTTAMLDFTVEHGFLRIVREERRKDVRRAGGSSPARRQNSERRQS